MKLIDASGRQRLSSDAKKNLISDPKRSVQRSPSNGGMLNAQQALPLVKSKSFPINGNSTPSTAPTDRSALPRIFGNRKMEFNDDIINTGNRKSSGVKVPTTNRKMDFGDDIGGNRSLIQDKLRRQNTSDELARKLDKQEFLKLENEVLEALSLVRLYPQKTAKILEKQLSKFDGTDFYLAPGQILVTREGKHAVLDAIKFLKKQEPVPKLSSRNNPGLRLAASDHVHDNGTTGSQEHEGSDGSKPYERMERYGMWENNCGECLWYGESRKGLEMVLDLIIDDGVPDRSHRDCIYTECYRTAGVKIGFHRTMGMMLCIDFAAAFTLDSTRINQRMIKGPPKVDPSKILKLKQPKCQECRQAIVGAVLKAPQGQFHLHCFNCDQCGANLNGIPFGVVSNMTMCRACMKHRKASRKAARMTS